MIPLFFLVVCGEGLVAFLLMVKIGPLRELVMKGLDEVKTRRATVLTIAGTIFVILLSDLYSILKIQNKGVKHGTMTPMDRCFGGLTFLKLLSWVWVLVTLGFSLFLGFLIDRMHHYLRKLVKLRSTTGVSKQEFERLENEKLQLKEKEEKAAGEVKRLQKEISDLTENLKNHKLESTEKDKKVETAESHVVALQKQAADLLLEYDRLLEDNQILQNKALGYRG